MNIGRGRGGAEEGDFQHGNTDFSNNGSKRSSSIGCFKKNKVFAIQLWSQEEDLFHAEGEHYLEEEAAAASSGGNIKGIKSHHHHHHHHHHHGHHHHHHHGKSKKPSFFGSLCARWAKFLREKLLSVKTDQRIPYLKNPWNYLDLFVVIVSWADEICSRIDGAGTEELSGLRILRLFRALRPLRLVARNPSLRLVVDTILQVFHLNFRIYFNIDKAHKKLFCLVTFNN